MKRYSEYKDSGVKWIGEIPKHWKVNKLFRLFNSFGSGTTPNGENYYGDDVPWINSGDLNNGILSSVKKHVKNSTISTISTLKIYPKDTLMIAMYGASIGKVAKLALEGCCNQACFAIYNKKHNINLDYAFYTLLCCKKYWEDNSKGGTQPNINANIIKQTKITTPLLTEQTEIVSYLDTKVSKIDRYISTAEKKIAALDELKQVTIADAVTHGINPKAKMKDSGIPWIGMVPEHWEVRKMKFLFNEISEKGHPYETCLCSTQKYGVIPQSMYENRVVVVNKGLENLKFVRIGNFVISLRSFQGGIEMAHYQGIISAAYTVLALANNKLAHDYVKFLFKSNQYIQLLQTCVTGIREGQNINYELLRKQFLPLPPLSEQNAIVSYIDRKVAQIDKMKAAELSQIEKLKEYKQRLISDVVTGKVKVTND